MMLSSYKIYSPLHEFTQDKKMATVSDGKAIPPMKTRLKFHFENYSYIVLLTD